MGATEEQMALLTTYNITHVAYILVLYSFAFILYLFVNILLHIYSVCSAPPVPPKDVEYNDEGMAVRSGPRVERMPRRGHRHTDSHQIREAEEFELGALLSEDEDAVERRSDSPPSTVGKNSVGRV